MLLVGIRVNSQLIVSSPGILTLLVVKWLTLFQAGLIPGQFKLVDYGQLGRCCPSQ